MTANGFFSFARLGALLTKEFIQMRRDRITFAMMLGVPLMQLVLFGFAINSDPKGLPAALVATSGVLTWWGIQFSEMNGVQESAAMEIPMSIPYAALPAGDVPQPRAAARGDGQPLAVRRE